MLVNVDATQTMEVITQLMIKKNKPVMRIKAVDPICVSQVVTAELHVSVRR